MYQSLVITQPAARSGGTVLGGPVMSRAVEKEEDLIPDELKTVFDWCKEGHVTNLAAMVTAENINETCDNVRCNATCTFSKSDQAAGAVSFSLSSVVTQIPEAIATM